MYYEPYNKKKKSSARGRAPEREAPRRGCLGRAVWIGLKLAFKLAFLALFLAVVAYLLPPGLFLVEPQSDLSIASGLPGSRVNVLFLGVDKIHDGSQRSDTIMICSIGYNSVKLVSILRDTLVDIPGHGRGRINSAYAYGGAELAVKTVNENFGLNISKYAVADFVTLAKLIDAVGGVKLAISEEEMEQINYNSRKAFGSEAGKKLMGYELKALENYSADGETPVLLNGLHALGYARIRKLDSDFVRTFRQRKLINAAIQSVKGNLWNPMMYTRVIRVLAEDVDTNLGFVEIVSLGSKALLDGQADQLRVPVEGSYQDTGSTIQIDLEENRRSIHGFLYG